MAKRRQNQDEEEVQVEEVQVEQVQDAPADVIAADSIGAVQAEQAVREDSDQAELSGGVGDASGDGILDKNAESDGPTGEEVEAANSARVARGEDPVEGIGDDALPEEPEEGSEMWIRNNFGEDTMAVRQSNVDRVVDGEIVRAADNVDNMSTTKEGQGNQ